MIIDKSITATVYIYQNGKILLHQHKKYKTWFPVGGHINSNEFPYEGAIREVKEETGFEIELVKTELMPETDIGRVKRVPLPFCTYYEGASGDEQFLDFIYIAITKEHTPHPDKGESTQFKWFNKEELMTSEIKPHIKNTALEIIKYMEQNKIK